MQVVLSQAVERLRRDRFFAELNAAYETLWADSEAAADERAERELLEGTLMDGLEDDPYPG